MCLLMIHTSSCTCSSPFSLHEYIVWSSDDALLTSYFTKHGSSLVILWSPLDSSFLFPFGSKVRVSLKVVVLQNAPFILQQSANWLPKAKWSA